MVFKKCCITTRTKQWKSEPFLDRRRVRIFCFFRKAERRCFSNRCVSETLSEERPYHKGHNCKGAVRQKGHKHEVRWKSLQIQHGHRVRGASAPGWEKNLHWLHWGRGWIGRDHGAEDGTGLPHLQRSVGLCRFDPELSGIFWYWLTNFNGIFILPQFSLRLFYLFHANLYAHG